MNANQLANASSKNNALFLFRVDGGSLPARAGSGPRWYWWYSV